jgi:predicted ABC-type ATPase
VAERVAHGGHNIPSEDIERRFARSLINLLDLFSTQTDTCRCYLNAGPVPELVFDQEGELRNIVHPEHYQALLQKARP